MSRGNFTRAGFAPTPSPLDSTYLNTSGTTGRTTLDAPSVQRAWARGGTMDPAAARAEGDTTNEEDSAEQTFSGIPQPNVDLTGMTEEQRELLEYLQARVGQLTLLDCAAAALASSPCLLLAASIMLISYPGFVML
jgi:hypothetical protein